VSDMKGFTAFIFGRQEDHNIRSGASYFRVGEIYMNVLGT
jgi:hypothetical protein